MKDYKYSTKFTSIAKVIAVNKEKKQSAMASLKNLAGVFSDESIEKMNNNPDLLFISSNLIELNAANLNDDAILGEDLFKVDDFFEFKFFDTEHNRDDGAIGVITDTGYSLLKDNTIISKEAAIELNGRESICLVVGGCIWRLIAKELANTIELSSALENEKISTSFELLFDNYDIAIGTNGDRNALNAKIVSEGSSEFAKYDALLRINGGSGKEGDDIIFRILKGDILPAGAGIVAKPASGIKGILALNEDSIVAPDPDENIEIEATPNIELATTNATQEIIIINENNSVTANILPLTNMKIELKTLQDVTAKWDELVKNEAAASIQSVGEFIEAEIAKKSADYGKELQAKEDAIKNAQASYEEALNKIKDLENCVSEVNKKLKEISDTKQAADLEASFNSRMAEIDDTFDLDDESRAMLADEVKTCADDEGYASWMDKKKKLLKEKTRAFKQKAAEAIQTQLSTAGVKITLDEKTFNIKEVFASTTAVSGGELPNSSSVETDIRVKMANAFGEGIEINGVTAKKFLEKK